MNYASGATVSNAAVVAVGDDGKIQVATTTAANLIVDVQGYYTAGATAPGGYVPTGGSLSGDTRSGTGLTPPTPAKVANNGTLTFAVAGAGKAVPMGASAVMLDVMEANPATSPGWLTAYPAGTTRPNPSPSLNWPSGNFEWSTAVSLPASGNVSVFVGAGGLVDVIVYVEGYFTATSPANPDGQFTPAATRVYDSRSPSNPIPSLGVRTVAVGGVNGIPVAGSGITAVALNIAVITGSGVQGHLQAYADNANATTTAIQYYQNSVVSGFEVVPLGPDGGIDLQNSSGGNINVVVDVEGWYGGPGGGPTAPGETRGGSNPAEVDVTQPATPAADGASGAAVDDATGELDVTVTDSHVPGDGLALDLARTYASGGASNPGPFGYGWASTYAMHVSADPVYGSSVEDVTQENGSIVRFAQNSPGVWTAPSRVDATLAYDTTASQWTFIRQAQDTYVFDSSGRLVAERTLDGYQTTLTYNGSGPLASVADPAGRTLTFAWGACGSRSCLTSVTDPAGRVIGYGYDANANLTTVTDVGGAVTYYGYDASHRLTSVKDADGYTTSFGYNSAGQVNAETDPLTHATAWAYSTDSNQNPTTAVTDPLSVQTLYTFTGGELVSQVDAYGTTAATTTTYSYDPVTDGPTQKTTAAGTGQAETTLSTYDDTNPDPGSTGHLTSQATAAGTPAAAITQFNYTANNQLSTSISPGGETITDTYTNGDLTQQQTPIGGGATSTETLTYAPQHAQDPATVAVNGQPPTSYAYDAYGDPLTATDPLFNKTSYAYDVLGQKTAMVAPRGNVTGANPAAFTTTYAYDPYGQVTSTVDPLGHTTAATYDPYGRQLTATDADGGTTTNVYNADGQLTQTTQADGTTIAYAYDADGRKTSQTDANGQATTYTYDPLGHQLSVTDPLGHVTSDAYDANGNQTSQTDADGNVTTNSYDAANHLTSATQGAGTGQAQTVTYTYDADGNKHTYTDANNDTTTWTYNSLDQLTAQQDPLGKTTTYTYDANGNKLTATNPDGQTTTWAYNDDNQVCWTGIGTGACASPPAGVTTYAYTPDGKTATMSDASRTTTNAYDDADDNSPANKATGPAPPSPTATTRPATSPPSATRTARPSPRPTPR